MPDENGRGICDACGAKCCRYVVVEIDRPTAKADRDEIRWFLAHENVLVYIDGDDGTWNVQFNTPCRHLDAKNRCTIYRRRFEVCRDHDPETCEASDGEHGDTVFRTTGEFDRWWRSEQARRRRRRAKRKKRKGARSKKRPARKA